MDIAFIFNNGLSEKFTRYQSEKTTVTKPTIIEQVITQTIVKNIENKVNEYNDEGSVKKEIQLDTYKNRLFYLLSKFKFNDNEISNFQNASYCMYRFNISNPLISTSFYGSNTNLGLKDEMHFYWNKTVEIEGNKYYICKQSEKYWKLIINDILINYKDPEIDRELLLSPL